MNTLPKRNDCLQQLQALEYTAKPTVPSPSISVAMQNDNLKKLLTDSAPITYDTLMATVGEKIAFDFVHAIISKINIKNRRIHFITFKNAPMNLYTPLINM